MIHQIKIGEKNTKFLKIHINNYLNMEIKSLIRKMLIFMRLDITINLKHDRYTKVILKRILKPDSNCIDIGCHKGEILDTILKYSPNGKHYAFEPIPYLYEKIQNEFGKYAEIYPYALSKDSGHTTFNYVENAPAYSGILQRRYDISDPIIKEITVQKRILDEIVPDTYKVDFMKIDVEGGEYDVLLGAKKLLARSNPLILIEFGLGSSEFYGVTPEAMYNLMVRGLRYKINTLKRFKDGSTELFEADFLEMYNSNSDYYFVIWK